MKNLFVVMILGLFALTACQQSGDMISKADAEAMMKTQADSIVEAMDKACATKVANAVNRAAKKTEAAATGLGAKVEENQATDKPFVRKSTEGLKKNNSPFKRK